jgi:6-pyruvoyltetrahydropterin/6-carboxytetrahydropterin synthase
MAVIRIHKKFTFETAHALLDYEGACKNIHGHSYELEIGVKGKVHYEKGNSNGFVMDFSQLKKIVLENVVEELDHALVLYDLHPQFLKQALLESFLKVKLVPFNPTSENLMVWIYEKLKDKMPEGISICRIKLKETDTSYAEFLLEDNE